MLKSSSPPSCFCWQNYFFFKFQAINFNYDRWKTSRIPMYSLWIEYVFPLKLWALLPVVKRHWKALRKLQALTVPATISSSISANFRLFILWEHSHFLPQTPKLPTIMRTKKRKKRKGFAEFPKIMGNSACPMLCSNSLSARSA